MNGFLVDTNAISEYGKPNPEPRVIRWFHQADSDGLYASVITFGEFRLGIEALPQSKRRTNLETWLGTGLPGWFDSNLLPVTKRVAGRWAELTIIAKQRGLTLHTGDGLIAATALEHGLTLVTRNKKDFAGLGVAILNPWET